MTSDVTPPTTDALVLDPSAVVAVILREAGAAALVAALEAATVRVMSAAGRVELGIVMESRRGEQGADLVSRFLREVSVEIVPVDANLAERAVSAWRRYGKGRHPAGLNFGDCFSYALAEQTGFPLLCTGEDFSTTDLEVRSTA